VFGSILVVLAALLVFRCFKGAATRRQNAMVPLVAIGAAILVGAHALVDFSLQIQAVALTVAALIGAGLAQAESSRIPLGDGPADPLGDPGALRQPIRGGWQKWSTALVVSGLCGYVAFQGHDLALSAAREPGGNQNRPTPLSDGTFATAGETPRRWLGIPGLGHSAFDLPLAQIASTDPETIARRAADLTAFVAARPLSSQAWLSIAVLRLVAREPLRSVVAALRLSWVSGPNEGSVLRRRGVVGVALWDFLPTDARELTARDLARAIREGLVVDGQALVGIFGAESADTRSQVRALLQKQGLQPADLARIGLPEQ